jgi:23S rRNA (cytidine1920-2'-O)/16S rRNA (cytidine1409-2'-O)-methyltransferase
VVVMEGINARHVEHLPEPISLATVDASFISLKILLPVIRNWFPGQLDELEAGFPQSGDANVVALIKPQFEAGRSEVARGQGVVRDPQIHRRVLLDVLSFVSQTGYQIQGLIRSPILGPKGNIEFLAWLNFPSVAAIPADNSELEDLLAPLFVNT